MNDRDLDGTDAIKTMSRRLPDFADQLSFLGRTVSIVREKYESKDIIVRLCDSQRDTRPIREHIASHRRGAAFLLGVRLKDNLVDLVNGIANDRILSAALCARAAIETSAASNYLAAKLEAAAAAPSEEADGTALLELHRAIGGGRGDWDGATDSSQGIREPWRDAKNVLTMVEWLDRDIAKSRGELLREGDFKRVYGRLSDYCHPAAGTLFTFGRATKFPDRRRFSSSTGVNEMRTFMRLFLGPTIIASQVGLIMLDVIVGRDDSLPEP